MLLDPAIRTKEFSRDEWLAADILHRIAQGETVVVQLSGAREEQVFKRLLDWLEPGLGRDPRIQFRFY